MKNKLTEDEWREQMPPLFWLAIKDDDIPFEKLEIVDKWIAKHSTNWWYRGSGSRMYIFGKAGDRTAFKLWLKCDPFAESYGEIAD